MSTGSDRFVPTAIPTIAGATGGDRLEGPCQAAFASDPNLGADAWELRVFLGRDSRGRVRHKSRTFRGSKRAAEKERRGSSLAQDFEPEVPREPETADVERRPPLNDAIEGWKQNGWDDLSPVTVRRYENVWKVHIEKTIGRAADRCADPLRGGALLPEAQGATVPDVRPFATSGRVLNRACRLARKWSNNTLPNPIEDTELPSWGIDETPGAGPGPDDERGATSPGEGAASSTCAIRPASA